MVRGHEASGAIEQRADVVIGPILDHAAVEGRLEGISDRFISIATRPSNHLIHDLHITIDQLLAEGDTVTKRWTYHATYSGDLSGLPPTGKRITMSGLELFRLDGGKIVECWLGCDNLSLMHQLGVIPTVEQAEQAGA